MSAGLLHRVPRGLRVAGVGPIVVDPGEGSIRMVQRRAAGGVRSASYPARGGFGADALVAAETLAGVLERRGFSGRSVVMLAPRAVTQSALVAVPRQGEGVPIGAIVDAEVARIHEIEEGFEAASWRLPRSSDAGGDAAVMAQAVTHADAMGLIDAFEAHGLLVTALLPVTPVFVAAAAARGLLGEGMGVLIDAGWRASTIAAVVDGACVYQRSVAGMGFGSAIERLARDSIDPGQVIEAELGEAGDFREGGLVARAADRLAGELGAEARRVGEYAARRYRGRAIARVGLAGGLWSVPETVDRVGVVTGAEAAVLSDADTDPGEALAAACANLWTAEVAA